MFRRVLQILLAIAVLMLCYWTILWVLGLLGISIPSQILTCIIVILGLLAALGILSGRADNIRWWDNGP